MLTGNLSTRPFYNIRAVRLALFAAAVIIAILTAFNIVQAVRLATSEDALSVRATEARAEAERLRSDARRIRAQVDPQQLQVVSEAAAEANGVIERRAFSWSEFLSQLELALPDDVRVTAVQPRVEEDGIRVSMAVEAQSVEDIAAFMDALEREDAFQNVLPASRQVAEDGLIDATIEGEYNPPSRLATHTTVERASGNGGGR